MAGYQPDIYASIAITFAVAAVALACRLTARRITKQKYWFDDYFAVVAFVCAGIYCSVILNSTINYGLGTHLDSTSNPSQAAHDAERARLNMWIGSLSYASSIAASKISFLTFYWRIFQFTMIRVPIQFLLVVTVLWIVIRTCLTILQCLPVEYIWNKEIDGKCAIDQSMFFFSSVLVHCILDIVILVLPVFPIFKMHLTRSKKLGVVGLFSSGIVVCVASVFVLVESITVDASDGESIPPEAARNWYWAAVEVNMAVFSGSLPMLRPIVLKVFPSCMLGSDDTQYYDDVSAIRLSRTERTGAPQTAALPSNVRRNSKSLRKQSSLSTLLAQVDRSAQRNMGGSDYDNPWRVDGGELGRMHTRTPSDDLHAERAVSTKRQDL
ncbi:hypothetical protein CC79DRAFT_1337298 [Sarocladium strictum]